MRIFVHSWFLYLLITLPLNLKTYKMKTILKILAMLSGAVGAIMMILGIIAIFKNRILFEHYWSNYFYAAQVFIVAGIFLILARHECGICNKE